MDAGFYRGTSTDQDIRFTDKERKLLKQMRFEQVLDIKVDMQKVNLNVIKPWITLKLNEILGMEDDVVVEYVFTQLEDRELNPKKIQINLAGFLNAKRAREFMGELWQMFVEAQNSPEGIPASLVEKKVMELKIASASKPAEQSYAKATEIDWQHRYKSLTGGRYGKLDPRSYEVDYERKDDDKRSPERGTDEREPARRRDYDEERAERAERRLRYEEQRFKERKDLLREKQRKEEREIRRRKPSPSSEDGSPTPMRRFVENADNSTKSGQERKRGRTDDDGHRKTSKRSRKRHSSEESNVDEDKRKKTKRHHKKDKRSKKHKDKDY